MSMKSAIKQGFHFASDGIHFAEYVEAETIQEAEAIYKKVRRLINPPAKPEAPADLPVDNS